MYDYLVGSVSVGLTIVSGPDPDLQFSGFEISNTINQVRLALQVLAEAEPSANVSFLLVTAVLNIDAQPLPGPCPDDYETCEAVWRNPALVQLGCVPVATGAYEYDSFIRADNYTTWAYTAFFTKYPLTHFAYTTCGATVMQYSNGPYGPGQLYRVFAYETCSLFGAANELEPCSCGPSGYFSIPNDNCDTCPDTGYPKVSCLMKKIDLNSICFWTRRQLGWPAWNMGRPVSNQTALEGPITLCEYQNTLYLIYREYGGTQIYVTTSIDGINWTDRSPIPDQYCGAGMSSVVFNSRLWLAYQDDDADTGGQLWVSSMNSDNTWNHAFPVGNQKTGGTVTLSVYNNLLYLIYTDNGNPTIMWMTTSQDGWTWTDGKIIDGQLCSPALSSAVFIDFLWLVYEDNNPDADGLLWITFLNPDHSTWSEAKNIGTQKTSGPITLCAYNNRLYVIYRDNSSSRLYYTSSTDGFDWLNGEFVTDQTCDFAASAATINGNLCLAYEEPETAGRLWATIFQSNPVN
jgi:hypothetical protein